VQLLQSKTGLNLSTIQKNFPNEDSKTIQTTKTTQTPVTKQTKPFNSLTADIDSTQNIPIQMPARSESKLK